MQILGSTEVPTGDADKGLSLRYLKLWMFEAPLRCHIFAIELLSQRVHSQTAQLHGR